MSEEALKKALALIVGLTKAERALLARRLEALSLGEGDTGVDAEVYNALRPVLGNRGFPPLRQLRAHRQYGRFRNGAEALGSFVKEAFGDRLSRTERRRILALLLHATLADMTRTGFRVGPWMIGDAMGRVWSVVEQSWPGYLEAGLLKDALVGGGKTWD
jgi:hypothetical protein